MVRSQDDAGTTEDGGFPLSIILQHIVDRSSFVGRICTAEIYLVYYPVAYRKLAKSTPFLRIHAAAVRKLGGDRRCQRELNEGDRSLCRKVPYALGTLPMEGLGLGLEWND